MACNFSLRISTSPRWAEVVLQSFGEFLLDHAACERKASIQALSLIKQFPEYPALVEPMICLAREELAHFHDVYRLIAKRGLSLLTDEKDPYLKRLLSHVRHKREHYFLDRLLVFSLVEARGCERFAILAEHLPDARLKKFYEHLAKVEAGHHQIFIKIVRRYFTKSVVEKRLDEFLDIEAQIVNSLEIRAAVH